MSNDPDRSAARTFALAAAAVAVGMMSCTGTTSAEPAPADLGPFPARPAWDAPSPLDNPFLLLTNQVPQSVSHPDMSSSDQDLPAEEAPAITPAGADSDRGDPPITTTTAVRPTTTTTTVVQGGPTPPNATTATTTQLTTTAATTNTTATTASPTVSGTSVQPPSVERVTAAAAAPQGTAPPARQVAAAPAAAPVVAAGHHPDGQALAATGTDDRLTDLLWLGLALIAAGAATTRAARKRRPGPHHR
ncbi:hypothetical protein AB0I60_00180 [Actinosynnema sp. NPDC050436]|uniref:hypothetical protein n=1 Tax=Actinosynnema sp. NPDC050436 TaxID=3155659 RepID=UPI0033DE9BD2